MCIITDSGIHDARIVAMKQDGTILQANVFKATLKTTDEHIVQNAEDVFTLVMG